MSRLRHAALLPTALVVAARLSVIGLIVVAGGCASNHTGRGSPSHVAGPPPGQGPAVARVEMEDDGMPAQLAPRHPRPVQDDPSEPWSPNYGAKSLPRVSERGEAPVPPGLRGAPAMPQRPPITRVTEVDEDAIIRRAIAEHEMRRRD